MTIILVAESGSFVQRTYWLVTHRFFLLFKLVVLSGLMLGCQSRYSAPTVDPAVALLNSVAFEVKNITRRVSEIQQPNHSIFSEANVSDPRLLTKVTVLDYVGTPSVLLSELASRIGYKYVELGSSFRGENSRGTTFGTSVVVRAKQVSVLDIIRDVAAQTGNGIIVSVSEAQREVRLEYL